MMPRFMVNRLINGSSVRPQQKKQGSATVTSDTESDVPLLPGQTRVRKSSRALHAQEIQGDSESSDSGDRLVKRGTSDSDVEIVPVPLSPSFHVQRHGNDREITLNGTESNTERSFDESSDEDIADEAIQAYLDDDDSRNDVRDVNLIDWMLSRTRTIGTGTKSHKHSSTTRNRKSRKGKYTLDIVTRRARKHGKGKQTLLSFDKHTSALGRHDRRSFRPVPTENDNSLSNAFQVMVQATKNYDGKERAKRHPRHKMNGLYIFSGEGNTRIVSGRNKLQPTDANLNFRGSSSSHDWANVFLPPQSTVHGPRQDIQKLKRNNYGRVKVRQDDVIAVDTNEEDPTAADDGVIPQPKKIRINMSIRLLPPGVSFSEETHIRKGKLDQLLRVLSMTARVPEPPPCNMRGYNLHSDMGCNAFLMTLPNICEDILEFSTGLPETDHAGHLREWNIIMRVVCQLLSWFRETSSDEGREHLRQFVEKHAGNTVNRVRELELDSKSLDLATLQLDWFMVELIARAGCEGSFTASNAAATSTFYKALSLLVDHLVELDVHASVDAAKHDKPLNSSTVPQQSAELWVCLIHLLGCYPSAHTPQRGIKPFWSLVMTGLQKREERSNFKASEKVWETIFCLNALSQFSVYGVVTSQPKLPACWPLVTLTMNKIRLTADHVLDQERPAGALIQRDKYISVIILRCFYLCNKWLWQLDDASELFNALGELFRTRKFANLRHEKPDFPLFMLHSDWSLLSECTKTDSAFALFLKLIVKAAKANGTAPELSPKLKKFLSLAIPVGSLPFTKATPPSKEDLSMLFNRFSALAIGIYLDRASYRTRLSHARTYVAFGSADITTRITVIRGMMNLASLIRKIELPRDAMAEWIADISQALADELKSLSMPLEEQNKEQHPPSAVRHHLHICIQILLNSIRRILDLQKQDREYPEHTLISSLKSLCLNSRITNEPKTMHEMQRLTTTLLDARSSALPPSERPHIISDVNTESQEEYNASFDFDFNDPDLIAALGDADGADMANHKINDENLYRAITETNLFWLCWRNLAKFIQELNEKPLTAARLRLLDNHIYCWLGCGDILVHNDSNKSWPMILEQRSHWAIKNEAIQRRVDLGVAMRLLKLHPMIYSTHVNMFLETFLESLAAEDRSIEHEYASLLLSIDGLRHPLLQGLTCVEKSDRGDYNISISDFSTLRLPILRVILDNLNSALERGIGSSAADLALENRTFVGYCIKGFSVMRNVCSTLKEGSQEYKSYVHWCKQVFEFIQGLDYVRSHERLTYWTSWGRSLHIIS
ncbi:hypothetical protein AX15_003568 [Amanita polypyramis BW_CC]|nr:hypothetical protein AX15_003568 [Amanita polypyramis BW_CC]